MTAEVVASVGPDGREEGDAFPPDREPATRERRSLVAAAVARCMGAMGRGDCVHGSDPFENPCYLRPQVECECGAAEEPRR